MSRGAESGRGRTPVALWVGLAVLVVAVPLAAMLHHKPRAPSAPPILGEVPVFSLVNQKGDDVTRDDLLGRVWIVDFFFTRCTQVCPLLTHHMQQIQTILDKQDPEERVGLLSISVDPQDDRPKVLTAYAKHWQAEPRRWTFLTGDQTAVEKAVTRGFRITMGKPPPEKGGPSDFQIVHGQRMVLVDGEGHIRGYFDTDAASRAKLVREALSLAAERETPSS